MIEFLIPEAFACCQKEGRDNLHWVEAKDGDVPPAALKVFLLLGARCLCNPLRIPRVDPRGCPHGVPGAFRKDRS